MDGILICMQTPADGLNRILETLDRLEIPYMVVGSAASSVHGIARPTLDIDLVADLRVDQIDDFAGGLKVDFYADPETMKQAIQRGRSFNVIQLATTFKFDIFPLARDEFSLTQFGRRQFSETKSLGNPIECAVASAEDTILNKLRWYRLGGETSERQWNDLRGIVRIQGDTLDQGYLNIWAPRLGVDDLLERLLHEGTPSSFGT
jgi:hypothetical protein